MDIVQNKESSLYPHFIPLCFSQKHTMEINFAFHTMDTLEKHSQTHCDNTD